MLRPTFAVGFGALLAMTVVACSDSPGAPDAMLPTIDATPPDAMVAPWPALYTPVDLPNDELALAALQRLGANVPDTQPNRCQGCHGLTRQQMQHWHTLTTNALSDCLTTIQNATVSQADAMVTCLHMNSNPEAPYVPRRVGVLAAGAHLPWFDRLFEGSSSAADHGMFVSQAGMPRGENTPLTQADFDIVLTWFQRGLPQLEETLPEGPGPGNCTPGVDATVGTRVAELAITGWRQRNTDSNLLMYGCQGAAEPLACLADKPRAGDVSAPWSDGWEYGVGQLRILNTQTVGSSFWTRSSADGRLVGQGGGPGGQSTVFDLARDVTIGVQAAYDPAFAPDNSAFVFQGFGNNMCPQSVLTAGEPSNINMNEAGCSNVGAIGLYEHLGQMLSGGDYVTVHGEFVSDDGGHDFTPDDPTTSFFGSQAYVHLVPTLFTGTGFQAKQETAINLPFEGDAVLSPSGTFMVTRAGGQDQTAFRMHEVTATAAADEWNFTTQPVGEYCATGGKPAFSYDERWLVYHHYVGGTGDDADAIELGFADANDARYVPYAQQGAANIYLIDLVTGVRTRITSMGPGQYALFPHFRSDGWIYFIVRDPFRSNAQDEVVVASDAALRLETL